MLAQQTATLLEGITREAFLPAHPTCIHEVPSPKLVSSFAGSCSMSFKDHTLSTRIAYSPQLAGSPISRSLTSAEFDEPLRSRMHSFWSSPAEQSERRAAAGDSRHLVGGCFYLCQHPAWMPAATSAAPSWRPPCGHPSARLGRNGKQARRYAVVSYQEPRRPVCDAYAMPWPQSARPSWRGGRPKKYVKACRLAAGLDLLPQYCVI